MNDIPTHTHNCINTLDSQSIDIECLTLSIPQAAAILGISDSLAYKQARTGTLPGVFKIGGRFLVSKYKLNLFINGEAGNAR